MLVCLQRRHLIQRHLQDRRQRRVDLRLRHKAVRFEVIEVPGALEIPTAIGLAERLADYDGYVALGCVIRGETTHYDTVCNDSSRAITLLGLQGACIGNGILTVENKTQADVRADPAGQDKGGGAAAAALHLIALARSWTGTRKGIGFRSETGPKA